MDNHDIVKHELRSETIEFQIVESKSASKRTLQWRLKDRVSDMCQVSGQGLGTLICTDGTKISLDGERFSIRKASCFIPGVGKVDGIVAASTSDVVGEAEISFAVHGKTLYTQTKVNGTLEDLKLKELRIWDGEIILGDGHRGYDELEPGALVDGFISAQTAIVLLIAVGIMYLTIYLKSPEVDAKYLLAHYTVISLLCFPLVNGFSAGLVKGPRSMFTNGWQSWSYCGSVQMGKRQPRPFLHSYFTRAMHVGANGDLLPPNKNSGKFMRYFSEMFTAICDTELRGAVVAGFLSQKQHFGGLDFDRIMRSGVARCACDDQELQKGSSFETDWFLFQLLPVLPEEPLAEYCDLVAQANPPKFGHFGETPLGWCSWYHYYDKVTSKDLTSNMDHLLATRDRVPLDIFQLDDGYQTHWGDWTPNRMFPSDMREISGKIEKHGFTPGIWLAPFSADMKSNVVKEHPDWILRDRRGKIANSGNCGKFFCGLDATHPEVVEHARSKLKLLCDEWGFKYLKLDFLYSCILADGPRYDQSRTRAQTFNSMLQMIRDTVGSEVFIVGCGCPLGTAVGYVNAMRIGSDVDKRWFPFLKWDEWNLPAARNAVRNTLTRSMLHRRWWVNDPDCVLFREGTLFTDEEIVGISTVIAMGGGMFMLSDEVSQVRESRLHIATSLMPPSSKAATPIDLLETPEPCKLLLQLSGSVGDWFLVALCNWDGSYAVKSLDLRKLSGNGAVNQLHVWDFWAQEYRKMNSASTLTTRLPAHSARLYAIRKVAERNEASYVGSDFHFSCGLEVRNFKYDADEIDIDMNVKRTTKDANVVVQVPFEGNIAIRGNAADTSRNSVMMATNVWKIPIRLSVEGGSVTVTRAPDVN